MALYRRFVTYLFLYEDVKKGKNCGFAKIDARQGWCRMEIQMKGCPDGEYKVYMLHNVGSRRIGELSEGNEDDKTGKFVWEPEGIEVGLLRINDGFGSAVYMLEADKIAATAFHLEDIFGIYLIASESRFVASQ
ncbi:MAG: hypothetical protein LUD14_06380 [Clostridiales bacterium]|nr:hypothetical protein [Clostridiales bacterium]